MKPTCGQMLARLRLAKRMTQADFGFVAGWGTAVQKHLEHGKTKFTANDHLAKLIKVDFVKEDDRYYKWFMRLLSREDDLPDPDEVEDEVEEEEELSPLQQEVEDFEREIETRDHIQTFYFHLVSACNDGILDKNQFYILRAIGDNVELLETMELEELKNLFIQDTPFLLKWVRDVRKKEKIEEMQIIFAQTKNKRTPSPKPKPGTLVLGPKGRVFRMPEPTPTKPVAPVLDNQPSEDTITDGLPSEG